MTDAKKSITKGYRNIHIWIIHTYGRATRCEFCDKKPKRYEWALKRGFLYQKNINNFIQLCPSCHRKYDFTEDMRYKLKINNLGNNNARRTEVNQYDKQGHFLRRWSSVTVASRHLNICHSSIFNNLRGLSKSAGGYIWQV